MIHLSLHCHAAYSVSILTALAISTTGSFAQAPAHLSVAGTAFTVSRETTYFGNQSGVTITDVPGGRRFQAPPGTTLVLTAAIAIPKGANSPTLDALALHCRSSDQGPTLSSVQLHEGTPAQSRLRHRLDESASHNWTFKPGIDVGKWPVIRLEVQFPIGFDTQINAGSFLLTSITAEFHPLLPTRTPATIDRRVLKP